MRPSERRTSTPPCRRWGSLTRTCRPATTARRSSGTWSRPEGSTRPSAGATGRRRCTRSPRRRHSPGKGDRPIMKVVLFCGGLGTRLREYSDTIPKPMVNIGHRPILWHLMKYYAHYGHKDFILCLGHGAVAIKNFFLKYDECVANDFVYSGGGHNIELLSKDIHDWRVTFVDTGLKSSIGERLRRVKEHLKGEEMFLANYADGLCDLDLKAYVDSFKASGKTACFISIPAP